MKQAMTEQTKERKSKSNFVWRTVIITLHSFCLCLDCFISFLSLCLSAPMCGLCFTSFLHFAGPLRARQLELHDLSPRCDRTISKSLSLALPICVCANVMTAWVPLCFFSSSLEKIITKKMRRIKMIGWIVQRWIECTGTLNQQDKDAGCLFWGCN